MLLKLSEYIYDILNELSFFEQKMQRVAGEGII